VFNPQRSQQIDCLILEERFGDFVPRLGTGEGGRVSASKKARYVSCGKHSAQ
jgi:hypothetical protein